MSNLQGEWSGTFGYWDEMEKPVSFLARLIDEGGAISGDISEPSTHGQFADFLYAYIRGSHDGARLEFVKTYDGSAEYAHNVAYTGGIEADGNRVRGIWRINDFTGWFRMTRSNGTATKQTEEKILECIDRVS